MLLSLVAFDLVSSYPVYTIQPVVNNRFDNGFDNRLCRVYKHLPGCHRFDNRLYRVNGASVVRLEIGWEERLREMIRSVSSET